MGSGENVIHMSDMCVFLCPIISPFQLYESPGKNVHGEDKENMHNMDAYLVTRTEESTLATNVMTYAPASCLINFFVTPKSIDM